MAKMLNFRLQDINLPSRQRREGVHPDLDAPSLLLTLPDACDNSIDHQEGDRPGATVLKGPMRPLRRHQLRSGVAPDQVAIEVRKELYRFVIGDRRHELFIGKLQAPVALNVYLLNIAAN
jgi:hypothetical protein